MVREETHLETEYLFMMIRYGRQIIARDAT